MTLGEVLRAATDYLAERGVESPRRDAELLLARALGFARIEALDVQVKSTNQGATLHDNELFVKAAYEGTKTRVDAALSAAQALGAMAAAAMGAQNSLAYTGNTSTS